MKRRDCVKASPERAHRRQDPMTTHAHSLTEYRGWQASASPKILPQKNLLTLKTAARATILYLSTLPPHCAGSQEERALLEQQSGHSTCRSSWGRGAYVCPSVWRTCACSALPGFPVHSGSIGLWRARATCPQGENLMFALLLKQSNLGEELSLAGWDIHILQTVLTKSEVLMSLCSVPCLPICSHLRRGTEGVLYIDP